MDVWQHLRHSIKIERQVLHDDQTSRDDVASFGHSISNWADVT